MDRLRGEWVDPRAGQITVAEWLDRWLAGRRVRPSTAARDASLIRNAVLPHLGGRRLGDLTPEDIRRWVATLEGSYSRETMRKAVQVFAAALRTAVDDGRIPRSPVPRRLDLGEPTRREMVIVEAGQVRRLCEVIDPRYRTMVLVGYLAGLRLGETAALQVGDLDLLRRTVTVEATLGRDRTRQPPKTRSSRRQVSIPQPLAEALAAHLATYPDPDGWVFPAPEGGPVDLNNWRRRVWNPAVREAGLDGLRFHDLRHSHVAALIAAGVHVKVISERLGHSSIVVTMNTYGHLLPGLDEEAADTLGQVWAAAGRAQSRTKRAPKPVVPLPRRNRNPL
ncbi:MAG: site-specific integrase [Acidimicrobiia bacterium]|nr:MAG: site-specific integrase [Acidimicrobiia bacterium]